MEVKSGNASNVESKYLHWKPIVIQALLSSFVLTFYTLENSFAQSIFNPIHLLAWLLSFVLMLPIVALCAAISRFLDRKIPWEKDLFRRGIYQLVLGVFLVAAFALTMVYTWYYYLFNIDLWQSDYFSRDFVVVLSSILMINFYHYHQYRLVYYQRSVDGRSIEERKVENESLDKQLRLSFQVFELIEPITLYHIAAFYLEDIGEKQKVVLILSQDGSRYTMGQDTLERIRKLCPDVLLTANRHYLINQYFIKTVRHDESENRHELELDVKNSRPISISRRLFQDIVSRLLPVKSAEIN